jgi:hypothetical protein
MGIKMYVMTCYVGNITGWMDDDDKDDDTNVAGDRFHCLMI